MSCCGSNKDVLPSGNELKDKYEDAKQDQVYEFWSSLDSKEKKSFESIAKHINPKQCNKDFKRAIQDEKDAKKNPPKITPYPDVTKPSEDDLEQYADEGLSLIGDGKVGVLLLAGGQGTRLGSSEPKGCYDIGMPSHKSLFQYQAERIKRLQDVAAEQEHHKVSIPWYIMTSAATRDATEKFFEDNDFFGLKEDQVTFFNQGFLPCFSNDGKIILENRSKIATAPDGNGGVYEALKNEKIIGDMKKRGLKYIHVYCVDNALVKVADPVHIGFTHIKKLDASAKVIGKAYSDEPLGVYTLKDGRMEVVEYSELPEEDQQAKDKNGGFKFNAGNICIHCFHIDFLEDVCDKYYKEMTFHIARKKIPYADKKGKTVKPEKNNGIKLERFIFDVFGFAENAGLLAVDRSLEFSPLKNPPKKGLKDSPETCCEMMSNMMTNFVLNNGGHIEGNKLFEVSPLLSIMGEDLDQYVDGREFRTPFHLSEKNAKRVTKKPATCGCF